MRMLKSSLMTCVTSALLANVVSAQVFTVDETGDAIVVSRGGKPIVTYNKVSPSVPEGIDAIYERSGCLHPVNTPAGGTVTQMFPAGTEKGTGVF